MGYKLPGIKDRMDNHPLYDKYANEYDFLLDALEGGEDFVTKDYLLQHSFEDSSAYQTRLKRAWYFDIARKVLNSFVEPIFKEGVIRKGVDEYLDFIDDATGYGDPLDDFMCEAGILSAYFGSAYIFVDYAFTSIDEGVDFPEYSSSAEEIMPTVSLFSPTQLINWDKRRRHGFMWATFKTTKVVEGDEVDVYIIVDYEKIYEVDENGNNIVKPFEHGLGYTPVFQLNFPSSFRINRRQGLGLGLAYIMKGILNNISLAEELGERNAFYQLTLPDDGSIEEWQAKQSELRQMQYDEEYNLYLELANADSFIEQGLDPALRRLAKSTVLTFPANTGHPPNYISPPVSGMGNVWKIVRDAIFFAMYLSGIQRYDGSFDMEYVSNKLAKFCKSMALVEKRIFQTIGKYIGKEAGDDLEILYPDTFSLDSLQSWIVSTLNISNLVQTGLSPEYVSELIRELTYILPLPISQIQKGKLAKMVSFSAVDSNKK